MSNHFLRIGIILLFAFLIFPHEALSQHRKRARIHHNQLLDTSLPNGFNELFAGSVECLLCHNSMTDTQGNPHGILNDWRSTMMGNAAKDPLWRAKVSHESLVNPNHAEVLQDICTRCHAPLGNFNAHHIGQDFYSISEMETDSLGLDGVSCSLCHQITSGTLGNYSGNLLIGTEKTIWGPYIDPFTNPMINRTGYTPASGEHIGASELCGACHTLVTNSVDLDGNPTDNYFVEQAIYHEWLNSSYPEDGKTCQSCHVPQIFDTIKISTMPPWLDGRSPFGMHHFAGANIFMQQILKANIIELGITAEIQQFDSTLSRTQSLLTESTLDLNLIEKNRTQDSLYLELSLQNLAGHKFPSGFPSRRAFVEIILITDSGDTIFHSGKIDEAFYLFGEADTYEPHHSKIKSETEVQIYELVMGDINGNVTTVLERAYSQIKDNRLPPSGFSSQHYCYDTVKIAGVAINDENFNRTGSNEGSGADILIITAFLNGYTGLVEVIAKVFYQTVSPKWMEDMFAYSSPEIDLWEAIYMESDRKPILIAETSMTSLSTGLDSFQQNRVTLYPVPSKGEIYFMDNFNEISSFEIYALNGERIKQFQYNSGQKKIKINAEKGIYLIKFKTDSYQELIKKIILN